jgi:hypothetical protein
MMKPTFHLLLLTLAVAFLGSGCAHIDLAPHVAGQIIDQSTKGPIPNATVYFDQYPEQVVLSADGGDFDYSEIRRLVFLPKVTKDSVTTLSLTVRADNYQPVQMKFSWSGREAPAQTNETIYLQPK